MFDGYKTIAFFALSLVIWIANYFGFGGFKMSESQLELFNVIVIVAGFVLRYVTKSPIFGAKKK
jgi:hypothetical protein